MTKATLLTTAAGLMTLLIPPALAHDVLSSLYAPAGYMQDLEMRVSHGCKSSPVNSVRIKIPEGVYRVSVDNTRDWTVKTTMRKLPKPVAGEGGNMMTETVDEIIWSNPKSDLPPMGYYEGFKFHAALPNTPGAILFFRTINGCVKGDDKYVDLPAMALDVNAADFQAKLLAFVSATPGPSPFLILEKPSRPQYPWAGAQRPKAAARR